MKTDPMETFPKILELAALNLHQTGRVPTAVYLWVMKHPETGEVREEPGVVAPPGPTSQDAESWFRSIERMATDLDAVAAILVTELRRPGERYLAVQYERRGDPVRLWKGRIREKRGRAHLSEVRPDTKGVSTMTVLPPDPSKAN